MNKRDNITEVISSIGITLGLIGLVGTAGASDTNIITVGQAISRGFMWLAFVIYWGMRLTAIENRRG